jgi:hypothetical protein
MGVGPSPRNTTGPLRLLREFLGFSTPRAVVVNLTGILLILVLWPTDRLSYIPVRSLWETVLHIRPYSSGMMRALSRLLHGDARGAWEFNPLAFPVLAVFLVLIGVNALRWARSAKASKGLPAQRT